VIRVVAVVIPAANEAATIERCLRSVRRAVHHAVLQAERPLSFRTVVVLDSCVDDSEGRATTFPFAEVVRYQGGQVGGARAVGAQRVLSGSALPPPEVWLANTDADSEVPAHWLTAMIAEADAGADLVLGTVLPGVGLGGEARRSWMAAHGNRRDHPHVHGANLGVRGDAYLALGGWPPVASGEDIMLARRAAAHGGLRVVRTGDIPVVTSSRRRARAPHGFAAFLRDLDPGAGREAGKEAAVEG
jgi:glycosyltransferase involved in cell wall biosynthesis